jgi:hypothetical protein
MAYKDPRAYLGIAERSPGNQIENTRRPTANDSQTFNIGDRWVIPTSSVPGAPSNELWQLMSKPQNVAVWVQINSGGAVTYNDHELLVGTGTATINTINNSTAGLPLLTQGAGADPTWGVVQVPAGGTGTSTFTAYTPVCGGTTSTADLQSVASTGVVGQVLTSNGAGTLPTFQGTGPIGAITNVVVQVFTTPGAGTYTPTAGMVECMVEALGGGGGGGGAAAPGSFSYYSGGGGAGGYSRKIIDAATIGVSQALSVGAAGAAGAAASGTGGTGGATTFGAILTANGGVGSVTATGGNPGVGGIGGIGGTASGGDINIAGQCGGFAISSGGGGSTTYAMGGSGANSMYGSGGINAYSASGGLSVVGNAGIGYGSGGSGGVGATGSINAAGGAGAAGIIIITEYIQ